MRPYRIARQVRPSLVLVLLAVATVQASGQVAGISRPPARQEQEQERARPDFVLRADSPASLILSRHVTVKFADAPLDRVVNAIARQAGFDVVFEPGAKADKVRVSLERTGTPAAAALLGALDGSGLNALVQRGGEVVRIGVAMGKAVGARQAGTVTGRVTDAGTGAPLGNAEVELAKTSWKTTTDTGGRFRLDNVEPGSYRLTVRRLGYAKQDRPITVATGREDTVNVALEPVAARLDELVTTATGRRRRLDVPNDITTINADSVMQTAPVHSLTDLLENRVPGLTTQRTSGAPGDPKRLRLRGPGSPFGNNDPVVIVDGVRVYAQQSDSRNANLANPRFAAPSPLDYIDPNSIETIEVVKGPSAATLYGPDAANGVILITTKRGKAGPTRWSLIATYGRRQMAGHYPDLIFPWGHGLYDTKPVVCPIEDRTRCVIDSLPHFQILNDPTLTPLDKASNSSVALTASGGTQAITYSVTGSYLRDLGLVRLPDYEAQRYQAMEGASPPDWMRRPQWLKQLGATSNVMARLGATAEVSLISALTRTRQQRSTLETQLGTLIGTFLDRSSGVYCIGNGYNSDLYNEGCELFGSMQTAYRSRITAATTQFTNTLAANWRARSWLSLNATGGLDVQQRADETFLPPSRDSLYFERYHAFGNTDFSSLTGLMNTGTGQAIVGTVNASAVAIAPLGHGFKLNFGSGFNYISTSTNDLAVQGRRIPYGTTGSSVINPLVPGLEISNPVANSSTFGWYLAPSLANPRFSIDLGLRLDGGSSYGGKVTGFKVPTFPKLGFSYLLSDEPFFPLKSLVQSLRLRAAYGRAGRQPGPTDRLRLYSTASPAFGVPGDYVVIKFLGNPDVRPERSSELEGGVDADLLDSRLHVTFSGYRKTTDDFLVPAPVPPSVYGEDVFLQRNIGVVRNTGAELDFDAQLVRSSRLTVSTRFTFQHNRNLVVRLGPGVEPFNVGTETMASFSYDDQPVYLRVAAGYPLFGRWTRPIVGYADANGDGVLQRQEILLGDTAVYVGSTTPINEFQVEPSASLWRALTVRARLAHTGGVAQMNENAQNLALYTRASTDPTASLVEQLATGNVARDVPFNWIQIISTTRLDNLSVEYMLPVRVAQRLGAQSLRVSIEGSNLGLWTNYRGMDPNVNAFSTGNNVTDFGVLPQPRVWQVKVNAAY